jgi:hypothetical protein
VQSKPFFIFESEDKESDKRCFVKFLFLFHYRCLRFSGKMSKNRIKIKFKVRSIVRDKKYLKIISKKCSKKNSNNFFKIISLSIKVFKQFHDLFFSL